MAVISPAINVVEMVVSFTRFQGKRLATPPRAGAFPVKYLIRRDVRVL
jgi:hypothetical protein